MTELTCIICHKKIKQDDFLCPSCGQDPINKNLLESMSDMFQLSVNLNNKINVLRQYSNSKFPFNDQRNQALGALSTLSLWLNIQLMLYTLQKRTDPLPQKIIPIMPNMTNEEYLGILYNLDLVNLRSFLTLFLSQIEVLLKRINEFLPNSNHDKGYKNLIKHILKELSLNTQDDELYHILYFPAIVRNTIHTNGIHTDNNYGGTIDGIPFKFEKNKTLWLSWRHVYFFCDKLVDALEIILKNPLIKDTPIQTLGIDPVTSKFTFNRS